MKHTIIHAFVLGAFLLTGCTTVQVESKYAGPVRPAPEQFLVYDLASTAEEVKLDTGLSALAIEAMKSSSRTEQEIETGHRVAAEVSKKLVKELQDMGLPAARAEGETSLRPNTVVISGHFISIDEGNRTERVVIGLGLGRTDVRADIQLRQNGQMLETLEADAKSGRGPGMAETLGVGGLTGHLVTSAIVSTAVQVGSESFGSNVEADGSRMAKKIAKTIKPFLVSQGWVTED